MLTPAQQKVADELLCLTEDRPVADPSWAPELRAWIDEALADHVPRIREKRLWISKGTISGVLGCEANYVGGRGEFAWSPKTARGDIVHRAVALTAAGSNAEPRDLAWAAIDQAKAHGSRSLATWLRGLPAADRVALAAEALPGVDSWVTNWPPLRAAWRPVPEYPVSADLAAGRIHVAGRVDLSLGNNRVSSDGEMRRRRLLVEVKTGASNPDHRAEHLLYALVECLMTGVAPWRAATYYTDSGTWVADMITEELLQVAAGRLAAAVRRVIELADGREPMRQAGWQCGFCTLADGCTERAVAGRAEHEG